MAKNINMKLSINGIGPHFGNNRIEDNRNISKQNTAIFAENGSGKTFISRMFSLHSKEAIDDVNCDKYLSLEEKQGDFNFSISSKGFDTGFSVSLTKGNTPIINKTGEQYIYHVFNNDYVKENIEKQNYSIDGENIVGYVIGKVNIDVSEEQAQLKDVLDKIEKLELAIIDAIETAKNDLVDKGVNKQTKEYKEFTESSIVNKTKTDEKETTSQIIAVLDKIKSIPLEIPKIATTFNEIDISQLKEIDGILTTEYSRMKIDEIVLNRISNNHKFYAAGLKIYEDSDEEICPFCNAPINENGMYYINLYRKYYDDEEGQIIGEIDKYIKYLESILDQIDGLVTKFVNMKSDYYKNRDYLTKYSTQDITDIDGIIIKTFKDSLMNIKKCLNDKKANISTANYAIDKDIENAKSNLKKIYLIINRARTKCLNLENDLYSSSKAKLEANKRLCKAKQNEIIESLSSTVIELENLKKISKALENDITEKQLSSKASKKELVKNDMSKYLNIFFDDKYSFDDEKFVLKFKNHILDKDASDVLSDGEKSIVAFCYYLATTHLKIEKDSDYNRLYFVIDDPISSMDFNYVYAVVEIIRNLKYYFDKIEHIKYLIFTHNAEFMASLIRNNISCNNYHLKNGKINKINNELLMPYNYHINDLKNIVIHGSTPTHTTGNTIRHIIETIMKFEDPTNNSLSDYILNNPILTKNHFLYTYINDYSHGMIRNQNSITNEEIINVCKTVYEFVQKRYPQQLLISEQWISK